MSGTLALRFTRTGSDRHRFEYRRPDGTGEAIEMESAGLLRRDLVHFAVERAAGLRGSFYGLLAKIGGYQELVVAGGAALGGEMAVTERVVEAVMAAGEDGEEVVMAFVESFDERPPRWLTPAFVVAACDEIRALERRWQATPLGGTLELEFSLER